MNIVFMGTPEFAVPALEKLIQNEKDIAVYTQPDRPKGRGQKLASSPIKDIAQHHHIPCFQPENLNDASVIQKLNALKPDLIAVVAYGLFIPKKILDIPHFKTINIHPSLLPKYRGAAPIQWALINGDSKTGVTILYVTPQMDAGDILSQKEILISDEDTAELLHQKLSQLGATLLLETLQRIKKGAISPIPQTEKEVILAPKLEKETGHIDWDKDARSIFNLIRGTNPWPGAYTEIQHELLKIHVAKPILENIRGEAGKIHSISEEGIVVETPKGCLLLTELQKANKRKMKAHEFIKGTPLTVGSFLGHHHV